MTGKVKWDKAGEPHYFVDGSEVTEAAFREAFPDRSGDGPIAPVNYNASWPVLSDALAVHPDQIPEAAAHAKARGVNIDFAPDGRAILTSAAHQKQAAKLYGYRPKRGY